MDKTFPPEFSALMAGLPLGTVKAICSQAGLIAAPSASTENLSKPVIQAVDKSQRPDR